MFYLGRFFHTCFDKKLVGISYLLLLILLPFFIVTSNIWEKNLLRLLPWQMSNAYFHALLTTPENIQNIQQRVASLPGVKSASVISEAMIKQELQGVFSESPDLEGALNLSYAGLRVEFEQGLPVRSEDLIREYLTRLIGEDQVTLGRVRRDDGEKAKVESFKRVLEQWLTLGSLSLAGILQVLILVGFSYHLKRNSYLVERYQRRVGVALKSFLLTYLLLTAISIGAGVALGGREFLFLSMLPMIFILQLLFFKKRYVWRPE